MSVTSATEFESFFHAAISSHLYFPTRPTFRRRRQEKRKGGATVSINIDENGKRSGPRKRCVTKKTAGPNESISPAILAPGAKTLTNRLFRAVLCFGAAGRVQSAAPRRAQQQYYHKLDNASGSTETCYGRASSIVVVVRASNVYYPVR